MAICLLVGNGINLLSGNAPLWLVMLEQLAKKNEVTMEFEHKPYTLIYEEISLNAYRANKTKEIQLKKQVASLVKETKPNEWHTKFVKANCVKNIITTNYDYSFEESCENSKPMKAYLDKETKYSNFRRWKIDDTYIWHIHGEADVPNSITLGHEQYSGTLQKMRNYLTSNDNHSSEPVSPFKRGEGDFDSPPNGTYSWLDIFLCDDVHIIGLGLDYTEIDLWWLLSYKARLSHTKNSKFKIGKTYFHYFYKDKIDDKEKAKHLILESLGVKVKPKDVKGDYVQAYEEFFKEYINL